jgi:hypothetical protein
MSANHFPEWREQRTAIHEFHLKIYIRAVARQRRAKSSDFVTDFTAALALFLHEHSHTFGADAERGFTDAPTDLLETLIRERGVLDRYETEWEIARRDVERERRPEPTDIPEESPNQWLATLGEHELRALIGRVPPAAIRKLRS